MVTVPVPASRTPFLAPAALPVLWARSMKHCLPAVTKEMTWNPGAAECVPASGARRLACEVRVGGRAPGTEAAENKLFVPAPPCEHMTATLMSACGRRPSQTVLGGVLIKPRTLGICGGTHVTGLMDVAFHWRHGVRAGLGQPAHATDKRAL